jgi:hypothetical protein
MSAPSLGEVLPRPTTSQLAVQSRVRLPDPAHVSVKGAQAKAEASRHLWVADRIRGETDQGQCYPSLS